MARITYPPVPKRPVQPAVERLFWRAGFGPTPADRKTFGKRGLGPAIEALVSGKGGLAGAPLKFHDGKRLRPITPGAEVDDTWAQEVLWWLDRMVRTRSPLVERMTLNLHDHFATSNHKVNSAQLMIAQNNVIRRNALGSFDQLCRDMTRDHAMQQWLDLVNSDPRHPNENYAREFMELFTIGLNYTQADVTEIARAFTGFRFDWETKQYSYDPKKHDDGMKTILGQRGNWGVDDAIRICLDHPAHAPYFCAKLWGYFVPHPPSAARLKALTTVYRASNRNLRALVRAILRSPELYANLDQPDMVKPPVVHLVGALRAIRAPYLQGSYRWELDEMGQMPFYPPHVGGWAQGEAFLTTGTVKARFGAMNSVLRTREIKDKSVPATETAKTALAKARAEVGLPWESAATRGRLGRVATSYKPQWHGDDHFATERRLVLRHLLLSGPDACVH